MELLGGGEGNFQRPYFMQIFGQIPYHAAPNICHMWSNASLLGTKHLPKYWSGHLQTSCNSFAQHLKTFWEVCQKLNNFLFLNWPITLHTQIPTDEQHESISWMASPKNLNVFTMMWYIFIVILKFVSKLIICIYFIKLAFVSNIYAKVHKISSGRMKKYNNVFQI